MSKYFNPRLLNAVIAGTGMKNPVRPHVILGSEDGEFVRGDLMDANAIQEFVGQKIAELVDSAPEALDTLKELSAALNDDSNFATTIVNAINQKQDTLVSGVNIKTINENSILDSGNLNLVQFDPLTLTDLQKQQARENIDAASDAALDNKEDNTDIVVESTAISTLTAEVGKYYRFDVPVDTLTITLPTMTDTTTAKTIVFYLTAGTTPAVTFSSTHPVYYSDGFEIAADSTYEVNALWNGTAWIVASVTIIVE